MHNPQYFRLALFYRVMRLWREHRFAVAVLFAVLTGAVIRFFYIAHYPSTTATGLMGDGYTYHLEAIRLADGLGYTSALGDVGAPFAHHPPGWVTLLGGFSALGFDTMRDHQQITAMVGLSVIVVIALLGRRLFGAASGAAAAGIAALYPGFWVLDALVLAEPLGLVTTGLAIIALYRFYAVTNTRNAVQLGVILGLTALVRSEQLALLALAVPAVLWRARSVDRLRRVLLGAIVAGCVVLLLSPWALYNATRFDEPVLLSTNGGSTLLSGNCDRAFEGEFLGYIDSACAFRIVFKNRSADRSVLDRLYREAAIVQIKDNIDKLPRVIAARYGRAFGTYRPAQTVELVASWHGTALWPVWAWVVSFWLLFALALVGAAAAVRERIILLPLLVPILVSFGIIAVFYGEPRYHTIADLSYVVLAGHGVVELMKRLQTDKEPVPLVS